MNIEVKIWARIKKKKKKLLPYNSLYNGSLRSLVIFRYHAFQMYSYIMQIQNYIWRWANVLTSTHLMMFLSHWCDRFKKKKKKRYSGCIFMESLCYPCGVRLIELHQYHMTTNSSLCLWTDRFQALMNASKILSFKHSNKKGSINECPIVKYVSSQ